jgi:hypothetical protein
LVHPGRVPSYGYPIGSVKQSVLWPVFSSYKYVLYIRRHTNPCASRWRFVQRTIHGAPERPFSERRSSRDFVIRFSHAFRDEKIAHQFQFAPVPPPAASKFNFIRPSLTSGGRLVVKLGGIPPEKWVPSHNFPTRLALLESVRNASLLRKIRRVGGIAITHARRLYAREKLGSETLCAREARFGHSMRGIVLA